MARYRKFARLGLCKRLVFAALPSIAVLFLLEVGLRWTGVATRCTTHRGSILLECDPILYFRPNPHQVVDGERLINRAGFRGREFGPKTPGVYRIVTLGDSCTYGIISPGDVNGLDYIRQPYPQALQTLATERLGDDRIEVLNAGVPGYNTYHGIMLLRTKLRDLEPDLITVRFGWNDHLMSPEQRVEGAFLEPTTSLGRALEDTLLRTVTYPLGLRVMMSLRLWGSGGSSPHVPFGSWAPNVPLEQYRHNLQRIVEIANERGAAVWLLTAPHGFVSADHSLDSASFATTSAAQVLLNLNAIPSFGRLIEIHEAYGAVTRAVGNQLGVPVVDMDEVYRGRHDVFSRGDILHPTQAGHQIEAERLYQQLIASGALAVPDAAE